MRGHRDDKPAIQENLCANHGNFLALLKFRIQAGDTMLQDHLLNSAGNALYTSKTIQNELITIWGDLLLNAILKKVRLLLTIFSQSLKPGSYSHNFFEVRHMMVQELRQVHQKELLLASLHARESFILCERLSVKLQGRSIDVAHAYQDISMVKAALQEARRGIDTFHEIVYLDAVALAHSVEIEESCPRIASYQLHRSNTPAFNASQYYRRTLPIPMLGHLITELDNHFEEAAAGIIGELAQILPSELLYKDDLPSAKAFHSELDLWRTKWKTPDGFDAVSVQNVGSTYIIVSWDLPTHSNGILINFSLYCNGALAGVLPLTVISYDTTGLLLFTLYMYITLSVGQVLQSRPQALHSSWNVVLGVISAAASLPSTL
eukprot:Em0032g36a